MLQQTKPWLSKFPWPAIVQANEEFCRSKGLTPTPNAQSYETARRLWEQSAQGSMSLQEALDLCRRCNDLTPFVFGSEATFAQVSRAIMEDVLSRLPQEATVEAQIIRNTVSQYVTGKILKREVQQVFRHFQPFWERSRAGSGAPAAVAAMQAQLS